ncbi:6,7-dimethyl-8-ribityllumazine synthase, partial [Flavobacteriaceae bacterium]|nr:6,7-dimethyl-8-ribityllumazine synthase [Flavobacteriaceae bacterium]
ITDNLLKGCLDLLTQKGANKIDIEVIYVPGSFELIYGCKVMQDKAFNAIIAIGSVIKGETKHFDFICNSTSIGIKDLNLNGKSPVIFCVLTDDNLQQSIDRSGGKYGNKGTEAAIAAIEMSFI